jgi:hypothetical protein
MLCWVAAARNAGVIIDPVRTVEPVRPEIPLLNYYNKKHEKYILTTGKNGLD